MLLPAGAAETAAPATDTSTNTAASAAPTSTAPDSAASAVASAASGVENFFRTEPVVAAQEETEKGIQPVPNLPFGKSDEDDHTDTVQASAESGRTDSKKRGPEVSEGDNSGGRESKGPNKAARVEEKPAGSGFAEGSAQHSWV